MQVFNSFSKYGLLAKLFHWITFIILILQIPFGFYLVGLEFSDRRIDLENIHILIGIIVFYITLFRLIWKFFNSSPTDENSFFRGQIIIAKVNHFLIYLSIFTITISGVLKTSTYKLPVLILAKAFFLSVTILKIKNNVIENIKTIISFE